ncbi:MAG TPA: tetratricopeptide repeat protein, partial [Gemmata sp.]|nr:tetratricopeptide repeat protein [Gemmata sp.]
DWWALLRHDIAFNKPPPPDAGPRKLRLFQVARAADPDELRSRVRLAAEKWDVAAAESLAESPEVGRLPAGTLRHLAMVIYYGNTNGNTQAGRDRAVRLLLNALVLRPGDFRLNTTCVNWYERMQPPKWAEAAHYWSIAVALRPDNPDLRLGLAHALEQQGKLDDANAQYREAFRLRKDYAGLRSARETRADHAWPQGVQGVVQGEEVVGLEGASGLSPTEYAAGDRDSSPRPIQGIPRVSRAGGRKS